MIRTPNYSLPQFEGNDLFNKEDYNDAFLKIDKAIGDLQDTVNASDDLTITKEIIDARGTKATLKDNIDAIEFKATSNENKISEVELDLNNKVEEKLNKTSLVNDLTTGGTSNILSAEQGKRLKKQLDSISYTVEEFGAIGDGITDDTVAINNAIQSVPLGSTLMLSKNYLVSNHILVNRKVTLKGSGKLKLSNNTIKRMVIVSANNVTIEGLELDGNRTNQNGSLRYLYDLLVIENSKGVTVENCYIHDSYGGGISVYSSSDNNILFNTIKNCYDNGILVAELGADRNLIEGNRVVGTDVQNGIFVTATSNSTATSSFIYDNKIINNFVYDCGDTSIESGIHAVGTVIRNNKVNVKNHPGLLVRDGRDFDISDNEVLILDTCSDDGIAVNPQTELPTYSTSGKIRNNKITGNVTRSAIFVGQDNVNISGNIIEYTKPVSGDGSNLKGTGILTTGRNNIDIKNNKIKNYENGIYLNYGDVAPKISNCHIQNNTIERTKIAINLYNVSLSNSTISGNTINTVRQNAFHNSACNGEFSTIIKDNVYNLSGFESASYNDRQLFNNSFVELNRVLNGDVPIGQYGVYRLLDNSTQRVGKGYLSFGSNNEHWIFFEMYKNEIVLKKSSGTISVGTEVWDNWSITTDESQTLILQRRGADTVNVGKFKFIWNQL